MKLSKTTIDILKNFSQINPSIMLSKGSFIMTKSINSVPYAEAEISDVIDEDIGIYDLNSFLNQVNLVGTDADIKHDLATGEIVIRGD
ncbi:LCP family protein, partial [Campylobacter sp. US53]|uniref:LCP family protein n=1 Tax=Campylobacter sp. US53 TaxID=2498124 RepID=UPI001103F9AD